MIANLREIILDVLLAINRDGMFCHTAIHTALSKYQYFSKHDRAFLSKVCEGTVERQIEIDYIINQFSTVPVDKMKPVIQAVLRSAVYQIRFLGGVPDASAVNEAVELAGKRGFKGLKPFVNGVLRSISRESDHIAYPDRDKEPVRFLSITKSMPEWLVQYWIDEFGFFVTERMLDSFLEERPTTVRFKTDRIARQEILSSLKSQGVTVRHAPYLPYAFNLSGFNYLMSLDAFQKGWIFPQDIGSMLVAEASGVKPGDFVVDVCAAPGGKSLHMGDKMAGYGRVEARDLTEEKVLLIRENIKRSGLTNIRANVHDALEEDGEVLGQADAVIADLPCSGLGVIGRKPDIKYRLNRDKILELRELQRRILANAARIVKPGGIMIFSTCTLSKEENLDNYYWIKEHTDLIPDSLDPYIPKELRRLTTPDGYLQLVPGVHESDGFFISRFRRKGG